MNTFLRHILLFLTLITSSACHATATELSFIITTPHSALAPGSSETFYGRISNETGSDLHETDLFFNSFSYDPTVVTFSQLLGLNSDMLIAESSTSPILPLFSIALAPSSPTDQTYPVLMNLEDKDGDISALTELDIRSLESVTAPEPTSELMVGLCLVSGLLFAIAQRTRFTHRHGLPLRVLAKIQTALHWLFNFRTAIRAAVLVYAVVAIASAPLNAQKPGLYTPGLSSGIDRKTGNLLVSFPIRNGDNEDLDNLEITSATLGLEKPIEPAFPLVIGTLAGWSTGDLSLTFPGANLTTGQHLLLTVRGNYQLENQTQGFTMNRFVTVPPPGTIDGNHYTLFTNKADGELLSVKTVAGTLIEYFGLRDKNGNAQQLTAFRATSSSGDVVTYNLDFSGRLHLITAPNDQTYLFSWQSAQQFTVTLSVKGIDKKTFQVTLPATSSSRLETKRSSISNDATSNPYFNVTANVRKCKVTPALDAVVLFTYFNHSGGGSVPGVDYEQSGTYLGSVPDPNLAPITALGDFCDGLNTVVSQVCAIVDPLKFLVPLVTAYCVPCGAGLATGVVACNLVGGYSPVEGGLPPESPNVIGELLCPIMEAVDQAATDDLSKTNLDVIATVEGEEKSGGQKVGVPNNWAIVFDGLDCPRTVTGVGNDVTVDFGGAPYCKYSVTNENVNLSAQVYSDGSVNATLNLDSIEAALDNCPYGPIPPNHHIYTGQATLNGNSLQITLNPAPTNEPTAIAVFYGNVVGDRLVGTLTVTRTSSLLWQTVHIIQ